MSELAELQTIIAVATASSLRGHPDDNDPCNAMQSDLFHLDALEIWDTSDAALAMIEHMGRTFDTEDPEVAVENLGKVMCYASILAYIHSLAIAPILELARTFTRRQDVQPVHAQGRLAAVIRRDDAEPHEIVEAIALAISKGIDDCEVMYALVIEPAGVFLTIGREMIAGGRKVAAIAAIDDGLKAGVKVREVFPSAILGPDGWVGIDLARPGSERAVTVHAARLGISIPTVEEARASADEKRAQGRTGKMAADTTVARELVYCPTESEAVAQRSASRRLCPQCTGALSDIGGGIFLCQRCTPR